MQITVFADNLKIQSAEYWEFAWCARSEYWNFRTNFGRNFRNSELNLEIGSKSEPKCSRFSALNLEVGSDEILN